MKPILFVWHLNSDPSHYHLVATEENPLFAQGVLLASLDKKPRTERYNDLLCAWVDFHADLKIFPHLVPAGTLPQIMDNIEDAVRKAPRRWRR